MYDPKNLQCFARYVYHERELFLESQNQLNKNYNMFKQTFSKFPNAISELRKDNDGEEMFIVAFHSNEIQEGEDLILCSLDHSRDFNNCMRNIDYNAQV